MISMDQPEPDTSALQDCEVMSADTSTTELGASANWSESGGGNHHQDSSLGLNANTPTLTLANMTSIYEFEEKDDSPTDATTLLRQTSQSSITGGRKRYDKPKKLWMQKDQEFLDDSLDSEEIKEQVMKERPKRRRRKDKDDSLSRSAESEENGFDDDADDDHDDDDDDLTSTPIPIKLKICRDPNLSGSYRVVPAGNGTMHTTSGTAPGLSAREVECCLTPDSQLLRKGDIVWAKITGYPFWPARVHQMTQEAPRSSRSVSSGYDFIARVDWFAWNQCSYISCNKLIGFLDHYDTKFSTKNKNRSYIEAVAEAKRCAEKRLIEDSRLAAEEKEKANTRKRRGAGNQNTGPTRRSRGGPRLPRGRPRGSKNRRNDGSLTSPTLSNSGSQQLAENNHLLNSFDLLPLTMDVPDTSGDINCLTGGGLAELPDLGPLGFVDGMKCDIPTFSDDDDDEDTVNVVKINTDQL